MRRWSAVTRLFGNGIGIDKPTYEFVEGGKAIRCLKCGRTSWHPKDVEYRYCVGCDYFHGDDDGTHSRMRGPLLERPQDDRGSVGDAAA